MRHQEEQQTSDLINALQNASVPTVLIVAGIFFLFLAIGGGIGATIVTDKVKPRAAGIISALLLLAGIVSAIPIPPPPPPTPSLTSTNTPTPIECRLNNLINCSVAVPISEGEGRLTAIIASGNLEIDFSNGQGFSGVAFQFTPALEVREFTHLDISGTATQDFKLKIEYKVLVGIQPTVVISSSSQSFPAAMQVSTIQIPLRYDGTVDEIALMFYVTGEASQVAIESIRLSK